MSDHQLLGQGLTGDPNLSSNLLAASGNFDPTHPYTEIQMPDDTWIGQQLNGMIALLKIQSGEVAAGSFLQADGGGEEARAKPTFGARPSIAAA